MNSYDLIESAYERDLLANLLFSYGWETLLNTVVQTIADDDGAELTRYHVANLLIGLLEDIAAEETREAK